MIHNPSVLVWLLLVSVPLHGRGSSLPLPHWVVLIAAVLGLWLVIGGGVLLVDRLLDRLLSTS